MNWGDYGSAEEMGVWITDREIKLLTEDMGMVTKEDRLGEINSRYTLSRRHPNGNLKSKATISV